MAGCTLPVKPFAVADRAMPTVHFYCVICGAPIFRGAHSTRPLVECPKCAHVVPVPDRVSLPEGEPLRVFPAGVLALEIVFRCECDCRIQIDARAEGKSVTCPKCAREMLVPYWSRHAPAVTSLSAAEVDFLTEPEVVAENGSA